MIRNKNIFNLICSFCWVLFLSIDFDLCPGLTHIHCKLSYYIAYKFPSIFHSNGKEKNMHIWSNKNKIIPKKPMPWFSNKSRAEGDEIGSPP